jgi:hypothetical protein
MGQQTPGEKMAKSEGFSKPRIKPPAKITRPVALNMLVGQGGALATVTR